MLSKNKFDRKKFRYDYKRRTRFKRWKNRLSYIIPHPLYVVAFLVFVASVVFIAYVVKPGIDINLQARQTVENITGGVGEAVEQVICNEVIVPNWTVEVKNLTVRYDAKHTFTRDIQENYSVFIGKVNVSNLENFSALFIVNYTFNTTFGRAPSQTFSSNQTLPGMNYYVFPFFVNLSKGNESSGSFIVAVPNYTKVENITYTNRTVVCS